MTSILKVDQLQDSGGNAIITSNGAGNITTASGLNTAITNAGFATTNGITEADQWRITADVTNSGPTDITANWERNDEDFAYLGTGMTESSGIFTFPSTGIWLIIVTINYVLNVTSSYVGGYGSVTTNNSTYNNRLQLMNTPANGHFGSIHGDFIFDVTDVTTHKFKLISESQGSINVQGGTNRQRTGVTFIRLGDT